jgi:hypothetical protein
LRRYSWQGIHRVHADKVASMQRRAPRRMGENHAWQAALVGPLQTLTLEKSTSSSPSDRNTPCSGVAAGDTAKSRAAATVAMAEFLFCG